MKSHATRQALIREGLTALLSGGYEGARIEEILAAAKVPKGSFYHFFRSKEAFVLEVLDAYAAHYDSLEAKIFNDPNRSPAQKLRRYFNLLGRELAQSKGSGCLYGSLAQTASKLGPSVVARVSKWLNAWEDTIQQVIVDGQSRGEVSASQNARQAAAFIIDAYEGAVVRVKASGTMAPYQRFKLYALEPLLNPAPNP